PRHARPARYSRHGRCSCGAPTTSSRRRATPTERRVRLWTQSRAGLIGNRSLQPAIIPGLHRVILLHRVSLPAPAISSIGPVFRYDQNPPYFGKSVRTCLQARCPRKSFEQKTGREKPMTHLAAGLMRRICASLWLAVLPLGAVADAAEFYKDRTIT